VFVMSTGALQIAARTALVYGSVLMGLRLAGKREIGR
jgi:uncharacterized membrane protein YcaP (DUF421 family)